MPNLNTLPRWCGGFLAALLIVACFVPAAMAQDEPDTGAQPAVSQTATQPPPPPKPGPDPGPFRKGKVRIGFYGGAGSTFNQTYFILGAGAGYYVLDGLEVGMDAEGWLFKDPTIWKLTPQVRYVLWQMNPVRPYAGVFWRKTLVASFPDYDSWGGRAGVAYRQGGNYLAVGVVYEKFNNYKGTGDDYVVYPEIALWISF